MRTPYADVRDALDEIAAGDVPAPRAFFVQDLEAKLGALMESAASGDLLPDIELAVPVAPPSLTTRVARVGAGAVAACVLLAAAVSTFVHGGPVGGIVTADRGGAPAAAPATGGSTDGGDIDVTAGLEDAARSRAGMNAAPRTAFPRTNGSGSSTTASPASGVAAGGSAATGASAASDAASGTGSTAAGPQGEDARNVFRLEVTGTAARTFLDWDRYDGPGFAAYLVLRANDPESPAYPDESGRTLILLRIENRDTTSHHDTPKVGTTPRYRIVVVGRDGRQLATSGVVSPASPVDPAVRTTPVDTPTVPVPE